MHDIVDQLIVNNSIVQVSMIPYIDIEALLCVMKRIPNNNKFEYIAVWNAYFPRKKTFIWV